jgi:hypothetical protein
MPAFFLGLARAVIKDGGFVYVITGEMAGETLAQKQAKLAQLGFQQGDDYTAILLCRGDTENEIGDAKERICLAMGIDLLIDNDVKFVADVERKVPCALLVGTGTTRL